MQLLKASSVQFHTLTMGYTLKPSTDKLNHLLSAQESEHQFFITTLLFAVVRVNSFPSTHVDIFTPPELVQLQAEIRAKHGKYTKAQPSIVQW